MFVNGVVSSTSTFSGPPVNIVRNYNWIGKSNWANTYTNAVYDEIKIYSGALNSSQILSDYQVSSIAPPILLNSWNFNGNYLDSVGSANLYLSLIHI